MGVKKGSVFIATPTHICKRYCASEFCKEAVKNAVRPYGCEMLIAGNSKGSCAAYYDFPGIKYVDMRLGKAYFGKPDSIHQRITDTALYLRRCFLDTKCEYYLSLEADVILHGPSIVQRLVERDVPVLHSNCYGGFNSAPAFCRTNRITMGCTLIKRHVIEQIEFRFDAGLLAAHYDALFAFDCNAAGIEMYYDPTINPVHREDRLPGRGWSNIPEEERGKTTNAF